VYNEDFDNFSDDHYDDDHEEESEEYPKPDYIDDLDPTDKMSFLEHMFGGLVENQALTDALTNFNRFIMLLAAYRKPKIIRLIKLLNTMDPDLRARLFHLLPSYQNLKLYEPVFKALLELYTVIEQCHVDRILVFDHIKNVTHVTATQSDKLESIKVKHSVDDKNKESSVDELLDKATAEYRIGNPNCEKSDADLRKEFTARRLHLLRSIETWAQEESEL